MAVYQFPKARHARRLRPRQFKNYGSYKRWLQQEFSRVCVYCRAPDTHAGPALIFQVDHYRPKSLPPFAHLVAEYSNLYYCCGNCNCRKTNYWPANENTDPWVVNPCEHDMAVHLRFNSQTGLVEPRSPHGTWTAELLDLNGETVVQHRQFVLRQLRRIEQNRADLVAEAKRLQAALRLNKIARTAFDTHMADIDADLQFCQRDADTLTGSLPARPLPPW